MRIFYSFFISSLLLSCSTSEAPPAPADPPSLDFSMVLGDWKVEGEPMHESWRASDGSENNDSITIIMNGQSSYFDGVDTIPM